MVDRNYQILNTLATGGTAVLYKAIQTSLGREVVIKRLHSHLTSDRNFTSRFELEAKAAASLDHENIVRIIDSGISKDNYFIVMEYIDGLTLKELLEQNGPLDVETTLMLAREICLGLDHAHQRGIIHRDVKPANIMITREGQVKITDFGLAKLIESHIQQTIADTLIGTPLYMSPEQAIGEGIDGRSDLFSLGTICYELITGTQPFMGPNYAAVIQNILAGRPPAVSKIRGDVDRQAESLIMKALSREPGKRFRTAMEMARAIEDIIGHEKLTSARLRFKRLVAGEASSADGPARGRQRRSRKARNGKNRSAAMTTAVAAVMVGVAAIYLVMDPVRLETFRTRIRSLRAGAPVPAGESTLTQAQNLGGGMGMDPAPGLPSTDAGEETMPLTGNPGLAGTPGQSDMSGATAADRRDALPPAADPAGPEGTSTDNGPSAGTPASDSTLPAEKASGQGGDTVSSAGDLTAETAEKTTAEHTAVPEVKKPVMGLIDIRVEPEADITIDGIFRSSSNQFGPTEIEPGLHRISCRQRDFEEYSETIRVIAGELSRRRITLRQMKGSLAFLTDTGISVFVDGKFKGMTPLSSPMDLTSGKHLVELKKAGFKDWSNEVFIPSAETVNLRVSLTAL